MLSVCIIAKNEEKVLEACLQSVATIADEIILLDTGSSDNTIAIAQKYNCRIYHYVWDGKFTRARNTACSYALHEWILCIDCDERLRNPECVNTAIQSVPANTGCIITERRNHAISKDGERSNEMRGNARLFRNRPGIHWSFEVHEETWSSCINNGLSLHHSDIVLDHEVWMPGYEGFIKKQKYYESLIDQCIERYPAQHYLFHSAKTRMLFEDYPEALKRFAKAETGLDYQVHNDAFIKCYKGYTAYMMKDYATAERSLLQALELIPGLSTANFYLINLYMRMAKLTEAMHCAEKLVLTGAHDKPLTVADMYFKPAQVTYWKAFIMVQRGDLEGAGQLLLHDEPDADSARSLALLSRIEFIQGNKPAAQHWLNEALALNPNWQYLQRFKQMLA